MATSDEVWSRGAPPSSNRVHVCCSKSDRRAYEEMLRAIGFEPTFTPTASDGLNYDEAFSRDLRDLERCDLLVLDLDVAHWGFCVGYAVARGKSIVGLSALSAFDFRTRCSVYVVSDLKMLQATLESIFEHMPGRNGVATP